jgi:hypothetical protein
MKWLSVALALLVLAACTPTQPTPPPSNVYVSQVVNVTGGGPSTGASPAAGALPAGSTNTIGAFGLTCPAGTPIPAASRTIPVQCQMAVTTSPKDANGILLPPAITGTQPDFFGVTQGAQFVRATPWEDEPFNLNVLGVASGDFSLDSTVKGVKAPRWDGRVVAAGTLSEGDVVLWGEAHWERLDLTRYRDLHDWYRREIRDRREGVR